MAKKKGKRNSLVSALQGMMNTIKETAKTYTVTGRKKRASAKARKPGTKQKLRGPNIRKRARAKPFLKTVDSKTLARLTKRGIRPLGPRQRSTFSKLKRSVAAGRKLSKADRKTWERLSKQVMENKIAGAAIASANKQSSRRAKSNSKGRRNKVVNSKKARVARGRRKGRNSKK